MIGTIRRREPTALTPGMLGDTPASLHPRHALHRCDHGGHKLWLSREGAASRRACAGDVWSLLAALSYPARSRDVPAAAVTGGRALGQNVSVCTIFS